MPIFHTAILLYDKKQYAIPAIAQRPYTRHNGCFLIKLQLLKKLSEKLVIRISYLVMD